LNSFVSPYDCHTNHIMASQTTFRFQLGAKTLERLRPFAANNSNLSGKEFRARWDTWCIVNAAVIDAEVDRLRILGYEGDVPSKIYRAGRYYFKTRPPSLVRAPRSHNSTAYIALAPMLIRSMDAHVVAHTRNCAHSKPAVLYNDFLASCTPEMVALLAQEAERIMEQGMTDAYAAAAKIKKTYKNRYFMRTRAVLAQGLAVKVSL
jgi:hypothetical protein